jgi:hypothetical protein
MAAPAFVNNSSAAALASSSNLLYPPTTITAGNVLVAFAASDGSAISGANLTGFTALGSTTGGGLTFAAWWKVSDGSETPGGSVTITTTGGTKGVMWMEQWSPQAGNTLAVATSSVGLDTASSSSAILCAGSSFASQVDDVVLGSVAMLAASGDTFASSPSSVDLTATGMTIVDRAARFGGRAGTNTLAYSKVDGDITAGGTGVVSLDGVAATTLNAAPFGQGGAYLIVLRQSLTSPPGVATYDLAANYATNSAAVAGWTVDTAGSTGAVTLTQLSGTTASITGPSGGVFSITNPSGSDNLTFRLTAAGSPNATRDFTLTRAGGVIERPTIYVKQADNSWA